MSKIIFKQCRCIVFLLFSTVSFADTKSLGDEESQYEVHHALYKEANLLLKNGEKEFETGFNYNTFSQNDIRSRFITLPLSYRRSITAGWEAFIEVPLHYASVTEDTLSRHQQDDALGVGDVIVGIKNQWLFETISRPGLTAILTVTAPIGDASDLSNATEASTGQGLWHTGFDVILNKTYDPVALYALLGFSQAIEGQRTLAGDDVDFQSGHQLKYGFGIGFAINSKVSVGGSFTGRIIGRSQVNGVKRNGTADERYQFNFSTTYKL